MKKMLCAVFALATLSLGGISGCGSSSSSNYSCCLSGSYYTCPDQPSFDKCGQFDPSDCVRDATKDSTCT